jgi:hypothetical protein
MIPPPKTKSLSGFSITPQLRVAEMRVELAKQVGSRIGDVGSETEDCNRACIAKRGVIVGRDHAASRLTTPFALNRGRNAPALSVRR